MHKKLGPLEAWQWAAILAGLLLVYYEYEKNKANSTTNTGTTSSTDTTGPIDPTTGLPYASEGGVSGGTSSTSPDLGQEVSDVTGLLGALQAAGLALPPGAGGSTTNTTTTAGLSKSQTAVLNKDLRGLNKTLASQRKALQGERKTLRGENKTIASLRKQLKGLQAKKTTKPGGHKNPGHHVTTHQDGRKTAASSAPHNSQQHNNIQAANHQKADAQKHKKKAKA